LMTNQVLWAVTQFHPANS